MRTFAYKGYDRQGGKRRGLIEATDLKEARERLLTQGILVERIGGAGGQTRGQNLSAPPSFPAETRIFFYQELGVLLAAGLPLVGALDILIQSPELGPIVVTLAAARDRVREGASLGDALGAVSRELLAFEKAVLEVGERTGSLDQVLGKLATFLQEQQRLRERIVTALIYPTIILCFALCVAVVMLGFVIPAAARIVATEARVTLPLLTRVMAGFGRGLVWGLPVIAAAGVFTVVYVRRRVRRDATFQQAADRLLFRLPVIGRGYRLVVNLRCARTLGMLLRSGISVVEAVRLAGRATGSPWIAALLAEGAEAVKHGSSLADAVRRVPVLAASLPAWIQAGEASGALEQLLETAGDTYQHQWDRYVNRTLSYLEPALIGLIGGFVLLVALSILLPIMALNRTLGG